MEIPYGVGMWQGWRRGRVYTIVDNKSEKPDGRRGDDDANGARRVEIFTAGNRNKFWGRIDAAKLIYIIYNIHSAEPASKGTNN